MGKITVVDRRRVRQSRDIERHEIDRIGLESALTSAVVHAQNMGADDLCDRLVVLKRDLLNGYAQYWRRQPPDGLPF